VTRRLVALAWLCVAIAWGAWIRVDAVLSDPDLDLARSRGLLRSDPALLYYITERVLEGGLERGSLVPDDFRADPRVQHPDVTDLAAEFAVGQEFLVAGAQALRGPESEVPLARTALEVMAVSAAAFVVGIYLAVRAASGSRLWGCLAVLLALLTPANYRTLGFLLVREDLSLPLYALHIGLLARALETRTRRDFLLTGLALAAALATWHALGFVLVIELGVLWLGFLRSGTSPLEGANAAWTLLFPALAAFVVPALRLGGLATSPAAALALGLWAPALVRQRQPLSGVRARALALGVAVLWFAGTRPFASSAYAHVSDVLWAKLRFVGHLPADPNALSFDARLLWQGPFETLPWSDLAAWLGIPLCVVLAAIFVLLVQSRDAGAFERVLAGLLSIALPVAWLFGRLAVLPGLFAPPLVALVLARWRRRGVALATFGLLLVFELGVFRTFVSAHRNDWYLPGEGRAELAALVDWVGTNVPADEAIAGDFVNSTALLAHTGRPIVLQPKYETEASRRKAEAFLTAFFQGSLADLRELMTNRFRCRYLLVDRHVLWDLSRYTAGLKAEERAPRPGTAAEVLLDTDRTVLEAAEGFELLYRSPHPVPSADYRVFRIR